MDITDCSAELFRIQRRGKSQDHEIMAAAAARPQIGSVGEFDPKKEDFYTYEMRLKIWMSVNKIDDDDKGKVLLALVGPEAFEIIMNQTAPDDPSTKPYADLVKIAKDYYDVTKTH